MITEFWLELTHAIFREHLTKINIKIQLLVDFIFLMFHKTRIEIKS